MISALAAELRKRIPTEPFHRNNAISALLMGALPAVGGSAISFLLGAFFLWGLVSLAARRFPFRLEAEDRLLAWTFTAFFALVLLTAVLGDNPAAGIVDSLSFLPFLAPWAVIPRLRASRGIDYLALYSCGAALGAITALTLAYSQFVLMGMRPEGGAGNAAVFAIMSLAMTAAAAINMRSQARVFRNLAFVGAVTGLACVAMSLTRGVWAAAVPVLLLAIAYAPRAWARSVLGKGGVLVLAAIVLVGITSGKTMYERVVDIGKNYEQALDDGYIDSSLGTRLLIWTSGLKAFAESPFIGHGIQNRMDAVANFYPDDAPPLNKTHAHNGLLTVMIDGGVLLLAAALAVLAAPIAVAARAPVDATHRARLFLALMVVVTYAAAGMTEIMFDHDILDSFFVFAAILIAASKGFPRWGCVKSLAPPDVHTG